MKNSHFAFSLTVATAKIKTGCLVVDYPIKKQGVPYPEYPLPHYSPLFL